MTTSPYAIESADEYFRRLRERRDAVETARQIEIAKLRARDEYLSSNGTTAPAQNTATPAPVVAVVAVEPASDSPAKTKRRTWRDVTETYLVDTFKAEQYPTVKAFYKILERKAGAGSPFDRGIGPNSDSLIAREVCEKVTYKMIETIVTGIRKNL